jgi:hypothetical protein
MPVVLLKLFLVSSFNGQTRTVRSIRFVSSPEVSISHSKLVPNKNTVDFATISWDTFGQLAASECERGRVDEIILELVSSSVNKCSP